MHESVESTVLTQARADKRRQHRLLRPAERPRTTSPEKPGGEDRIAPGQEKSLRRERMKRMEGGPDRETPRRGGPRVETATHADRDRFAFRFEGSRLEAESRGEAGQTFLHGKGRFPPRTRLGTHEGDDGPVCSRRKKCGRPPSEEGLDGHPGRESSRPAGHDPGLIPDVVHGNTRPAERGEVGLGPLGHEEKFGTENFFTFQAAHTESQSLSIFVRGKESASETQGDPRGGRDRLPEGPHEGPISERPTESFQAVLGRVEDQRRSETRSAHDDLPHGGGVGGHRLPQAESFQKTSGPLGQNDPARVPGSDAFVVRASFENQRGDAHAREGVRGDKTRRPRAGHHHLCPFRRHRALIAASISSGVRGSPAVSTRGPSAVTSTSSSMRTPSPRNARGTRRSFGAK